MPNLIIAVVVLFGGYWLLRKFAYASPQGAQSLMRKLGGVALMGAGGLLALRGAMAVAAPLFLVGLGLFGSNLSGAWNRKPTGRKSKVAAAFLEMELDHDSGAMDGTVVQGPLKSRRLSTLSDAELRQLHDQCAGDRQSLSLLEAWLDRNRSGWRRARAAPSSMGRDEAYAVLGLKPGASADDIRAAHKRLMKEFHPDRGGSDYLAAKINAAKDLLLQD
jgi:DnaJ domain